MKWHGISEVAKIVNRSRQAVYKKVKRLTLEEKLALGENLIEEGQVMLSDEGVKIIFGVSTVDNQVDTEVVEKSDKVDSQVNEEVVTVLRTQLVEREREVVRLDNLLANILSQLEQERRQRGEDRVRTDTILMKLTNDISTLQKALEYKGTEQDRPATKRDCLHSPKVPDCLADPQDVFFSMAEKEPVQREVSMWESLKNSFNDVLGFAFGRG